MCILWKKPPTVPFFLFRLTQAHENHGTHPPCCLTIELTPNMALFTKFGKIAVVFKGQKKRNVSDFVRPQSKIEESLILRNINRQRNGGLQSEIRRRSAKTTTESVDQVKDKETVDKNSKFCGVDVDLHLNYVIFTSISCISLQIK